METVLKPGQRLRNIVIDSPLGHGGMGSVWKGHKELVDMPVAVKVMNPDFAARDHWRLRFLQEAKAMAALRHDRIVPLNDFFEDEATGLLILVMPFQEGKSLAELIDNSHGGLPLATVARYMADVLSALACAHRQQIVHRDVKPSNIMISQDQNAYLMDFGIAKVRAEGKVAETQIGFSMGGTALYMSPEQIRGDELIDGRADIYSLGCVVYEALTGQPPFNPPGRGAEKTAALHTAHIKEDPTPLRSLKPEIPGEVERVILRAMAKDRDQRFANCEEFADALANSVAGRSTMADVRRTVVERQTVVEDLNAPRSTPVKQSAPSVAAAAQPSAFSGKLLAGGGVVAVLAIAGGLFWGIGQNGSKSPGQQAITLPSGPDGSTSTSDKKQGNPPLPIITPPVAGGGTINNSGRGPSSGPTPPGPSPGSAIVDPPKPPPATAAPGQAEYDEAVKQEAADNFCRAEKSAKAAVVAARNAGVDASKYLAKQTSLGPDCTRLGDAN